MLGNLLGAHDAGRHQVLERRHEAPVGFELLVPEAVFGAHAGGHVNLVYGRVEPHPGVAPGHRPGVVGKMYRPLRVLEVAQPVGQPEVQQIQDGHNAQPLHFGHCQIGKLPVVTAGAEVDFVIRQAVAQHFQAQVMHELQILLPTVVVAAFGQLVAPGFAVVNGGVGTLDAGGEHKIVGQDPLANPAPSCPEHHQTGRQRSCRRQNAL